LAHRAALAVDNARLYQEAQESIRSREVFITVASHELKTPMTVLRGYVDLLQRYGTNQTLTPEQLQRTLGALSSQVSRLDNLMDILWDLSRIQIGRLSLSFEPVDLCALTARLVEEIRPELERHTIELSYPETPLVVEGDVPRLEQIIRNLLHNAIKYSPEGGPVNVFLESEGTYAALAVSDRGLGIPAEAIPHLFERFFRVKAATGRPTEGLGVGLYVVRELVTLHGGSVEVESTEGEGSTFTVRLPLARPGPKPAG
jgi:signal transduction histidine kinase